MTDAPQALDLKTRHQWTRRSPRYDAFMAAFLIFLILVPSIIVLTIYEQNSLYERVENEVSSYAAMAAELTDAQALQSIKRPEQKTSAAYQSIQTTYSRILRSNHDLAYLYAMRAQGNKIFFVVDTPLAYTTRMAP